MVERWSCCHRRLLLSAPIELTAAHTLFGVPGHGKRFCKEADITSSLPRNPGTESVHSPGTMSSPREDTNRTQIPRLPSLCFPLIVLLPFCSLKGSRCPGLEQGAGTHKPGPRGGGCAQVPREPRVGAALCSGREP